MAHPPRRRRRGVIAAAILSLALVVSLAAIAPSLADAADASWSLLQTGKAHAKRGNHADAVRSISEAIAVAQRIEGKRKPTRKHAAFLSEARFWIGKCKLHLADAMGKPMASADAIARTKLLEDARAHLAFARRGFPANAGVQFHHGLVLLRLNRLAEAAVSFEAATRADPEYADAHVNLGGARFGLGQHRTAAASFDRALELDPTDIATWRNLGAARAKAQQFGPSVEAYTRVLALDPTDMVGPHAPALSVSLTLSPSPSHLHVESALRVAEHPRSDLAELTRSHHPSTLPSISPLFLSLSLPLSIPKYAPASGLQDSFTKRMHCRQQSCDWNGWDEDMAAVHDLARSASVHKRGFLNPFSMLALPAGPTIQRISAAARAHRLLLQSRREATLTPPAAEDVFAGASSSSENLAGKASKASKGKGFGRLSVAYVSPDMREHPVGILFERVAAAHNRHAIEVFAYALNPAKNATKPKGGFGEGKEKGDGEGEGGEEAGEAGDKGDKGKRGGGKGEGVSQRDRIAAASEHFVEAHGLTDGAVVASMRGVACCDVVVNLAGFTNSMRNGIFARDWDERAVPTNKNDGDRGEREGGEGGAGEASPSPVRVMFMG